MDRFALVNWLSVFVASLSGFVTGSLWYGPLFGKVWSRLAGVDRSAAPRIAAPLLFGGAWLCNLVAAAGIALHAGQALEQVGLFAGQSRRQFGVGAFAQDDGAFVAAGAGQGGAEAFAHGEQGDQHADDAGDADDDDQRGAQALRNVAQVHPGDGDDLLECAHVGFLRRSVHR